MSQRDDEAAPGTDVLTSLRRRGGRPSTGLVPRANAAEPGPPPGRAAGVLARLGTPRTIARLVWLVGFVALVSAASPALHHRLQLVTEIVPSVVPAVATTGTLAVGVVLMLLASGLRRGKYRAWLLATVLTGFASVAHLVKGLDVEEATLTAAVFVLLLTARRRFRARPDPRSPRRIVVLVVLGIPVATLLGFVWISLDLDGLAPGTSAGARLSEALLGLFGIPGPVAFVDADTATRSAVGLAVLGVALVLLLVLAALQPAVGPHRLDLAERESVRELLDRWGAVDSLSWFALREDRAVIFSSSRKAAVSYRVVGGVSLAAGDPLGDPRAWPGAIAAWLDEANDYGWVPGVLGASEQGAAAYHRAGLDALELGDEAVLRVADFCTEGRRIARSLREDFWRRLPRRGGA
jgi:lysyl-tRNA synthetase, class II